MSYDPPCPRALAACLAAVLVLCAGGAFAAGGHAAALPAAPAAPAAGVVPGGADLLPDLDQEVPSQLDVAQQGSGRHRRYRLGFGSGVRNIGAGPLVIEGRRAAGQRAMAGVQLVDRQGGGSRALAGAGALRYVRSPDHQHWHLMRFDRYELRRAGSGGVLVRDRKSGFCLGDRYKVTTRAVPASAPAEVYTSRCGLRRPDLRHVREGISVGYGDFYAAHLEYQDLPLDGVADGRYVLVHRVNGDRSLRESNYDNNAASVLLSLRWRNGVPNLAVLRVCPDSAFCDRAAAAVPARAARAVPRVAAWTAAQRRTLCRLQGTAGLPAPAWGRRSVGA
jgi:hypothetical protein